MAEGFAKNIFSKNIDIKSAGTEAHGLNPYTVETMQEVNLDISHHKSKKINNNDFESIKHIPIEISSRGKIGKIIKTADLRSVSREIKHLLNTKYTRQLMKERGKILYNYGNASKNGVGKIIKLFRDL